MNIYSAENSTIMLALESMNDRISRLENRFKFSIAVSNANVTGGGGQPMLNYKLREVLNDEELISRAFKFTFDAMWTDSRQIHLKGGLSPDRRYSSARNIIAKDLSEKYINCIQGRKIGVETWMNRFLKLSKAQIKEGHFNFNKAVAGMITRQILIRALVLSQLLAPSALESASIEIETG
jgi:hypothetical protein